MFYIHINFFVNLLILFENVYIYFDYVIILFKKNKMIRCKLFMLKEHFHYFCYIFIM